LKKEKGTGNIVNKVIIENVLSIVNEMPIQVQEFYRTPNQQYQHRTSSSQIMINTLHTETKERIFKNEKEGPQATYKDKLIRITVNFSQ
jgi:hypothetical protein